MSAPSYLKGVRTKYRNTLFTEIREGNSILSADISYPQYQEYVVKCTKSVEKIKVYISKLEIQSSKVADSLEEDQAGIAEKIAEEDCQLCSEATDLYLDLESYKERLLDYVKSEQEERMERLNPNDIIQIQSEMKDILKLQLKQQEEKSKKDESVEPNVKLPKIDIISFYGDKTKWNEFWDSFESMIHNNKKLSNIDKFNYLKSKLNGEAKYAISGLSLSNENYSVAIGILKERFGNKQDVIDILYCELMNLQCPSNKTSSLRVFIDKVIRHLRSLEVLHQSVEQDIFVSMIRSKLPEEVVLQLEIQKGSKDKWNVQKLCDKLMDYVMAREIADKKQVKKDGQNNQSGNSNGANGHSFHRERQFKGRSGQFKFGQQRGGHNVGSAEALVASGSVGSGRNNLSYFDKCRYCQQKHWSDECTKFKTIEERKSQLKNCCYKCLRPGHKSSDCQKGKICVHCGEQNTHHRSLCPKKFRTRIGNAHFFNEEQGHVTSESCDVSPLEINDPLSENVMMSSGEIVLMQTAKIEVKNPLNHVKETTRLMFDSGSQRSYISQNLATKLKLKPEKEEKVTVLTFGSDKPKTVKTFSTKVCVRMNDGNFLKITANIVPVISGSVHRRKLDASSINNVRQYVKEVELADDIPTKCETSTVDLLIGNDHYFDFILGQRLEIQPGLYLLASKLGWIVTGRAKETEDSEHSESGLFVISHITDELNPNPRLPASDLCLSSLPDVTDLWNLDSIGITDQMAISDDSRAMEHFKETLIYSNGRYFVKWPWKDEHFQLPLNRELSKSRLKSCVNKMRKTPDMLEKYNSIIQDQLEKGIVEKVDNVHSDRESRKHYMPHHAVITPQKTTTKLRIVYDASAKPNDEFSSLNECMHRGPVLLRNLIGIFIRFRLHKIAIVADIEKAFLQVGLQDDDRDVTRFLWLKDCNNLVVCEENIQEYRFCRIPFGIISSPFLLAATVENHIDTYHTPIAEKIKDNIYVDNLISGCKTVVETMEFYKETKDVFRSASMNLREWISNNDTVNEMLPSDDRTDVRESKVLGHIWNTDLDVLSVKPGNVTMCSENSTKRKTLTELAEVFDPLGFFSPVIVRGKIFLQELWKQNIKWDDELSIENKSKWIEISTELNQISDVVIPRYIGLDTKPNCDKSVKSHLLCFCDASNRAYSTVIYLHQTCGDETNCSVIFSKSRLAPVKGLTIPRLELMAVVIGVRSLEFIKKELKIEVDNTFLWTDSQCVLKWLTTTKHLEVFVKNRVKEIRSHKDVNFFYVPSKDNPADIASRGTSVSKLRSNNLWWNGPEWLQKKGDFWKMTKVEDENECVKEETSRENSSEKVLLCETGKNHSGSENFPFGLDIQRFSSYKRLVRVTAWINRFISKLRKIPTIGEKFLCAEEIEKAEKMWIYCVQKSAFSDVFSAIANGEKNNLKNQLGLFLDSEKLLRCKGRLENSELVECAKFPILLPRGEYARLLIEKIHKELMHSGVNQTLCTLRKKYWIPQGRASVRQILRHCLICRKFEGGPFKMPSMAPYPKTKVSKSLPFQYTGLDYLGPVYVKGDVEKKKRWICLYTCLVTRAIHLEVVNDMSTEEFLCALRRFISTRGTPLEIISDNASQFKLGCDTIHVIWKDILENDDVQSYVSSSGIRWKFNTELAPWMGGFYERLVGLVKRCMKKTLGKRCITDVQLSTLIKEIEAVLNSRPLVYIDEDINSNEILSPNHFLCINFQNGIPEINFDIQDPTYTMYESSSEKLIKLWRKGQNLLNSFWKIWREEYLQSLRERKQTEFKCGRINSSLNPNVGNVVIVKDELPRGMWKMGRIVELKPSSDGQTRSVKVQIANGKIIGRPINLLYPLEIDIKDSNVQEKSEEENVQSVHKSEVIKRPMRKSAEKAKELFKEILLC